MAKPPPPEFSHRIAVQQANGLSVGLAANEAQRAALARRLGLVALERLEGDMVLAVSGRTVEVTGHLSATVVQTCVVSAEPFAETVTADLALRFEPQPPAAAPDEEIELDAGDCDTIFYAGDHIDLGEALTESLALALDPYPRGPDAEAARREHGLDDEGGVGPFAVLKVLKVEK